MRRISLAIALIGAVTAAGCGKSSTSNAGGNRGMQDGTFTITIQNGQSTATGIAGSPGLQIKNGYITSAPAGLDCGGAHTACSFAFPNNAPVVLTAHPDAGKSMLAWAGDCWGDTGTCTLSGNADKYVVAIFGVVGDVPHPNFSDPAVHSAAFYAGKYDCYQCHGRNLQGMGIAPACANCHEPKYVGTGTVTGTTFPGSTVTALVQTAHVPAQSTVASAAGAFSLQAPAGPIFLRVVPPVASGKLPGETRSATFPSSGGTVDVGPITLSDAPAANATYTGNEACVSCHAAQTTAHGAAAHARSLAIIHRDGSGRALAGEFKGMVNKPLSAPRQVMVPVANGTIAVDLNVSATAVTGTGTTFNADLAVNDKIVYQPNGLGQYTIGTVAAIADDTHLTLAAAASLQPQVTSITGQKYGKASAETVHTDRATGIARFRTESPIAGA